MSDSQGDSHLRKLKRTLTDGGGQLMPQIDLRRTLAYGRGCRERGLQNRLRGAVEASWVGSIPIHPAKIVNDDSQLDSHSEMKADVWVVRWIRDSGESIVHAATDPDKAVHWAVEHFTELFDPTDSKNRAFVFSLPLDRDWDGSSKGARTVALRKGVLSVVDFDSGRVIATRAWNSR